MTYTTKQVAEILKLSADTVRAMILTGRMKALNLAQPGKRPQYRVTAEQLAEFQARATILKAPQPGRPRRSSFRHSA